MFTIELQTKTTTIRQTQIEGSTPLRMQAAMLYTIAQLITQTIATLHKKRRFYQSLQRVREFESIRRLYAIEVGSLMVSNIEKIRICVGLRWKG